MSTMTYPRNAAEIVATLAELLEHQGVSVFPEILRASQSRIEHTGSDEWNNTSNEYFTLILELPVKHFARVEPKLEQYEEFISSKLQNTFRDSNNFKLNRAVFTAVPTQSQRILRYKPTDLGADSGIWLAEFFRLFLSHVHKHKISTAKLKLALNHLGVSAFVAHEDIEPSLEWQNEIEKALGSLDAMVALLTNDFHASNWTDQEIGYHYKMKVQDMTQRYRKFQRAWGTWYAFDNATGNSVSLKTRVAG